MADKEKIYIIFEGIDGTGKSTLAKKVYHYFKNLKFKIQNTNNRRWQSVAFVREPGGTPLGEKIRAIIAKEKLLPQTQLFLFLAARAELYKTIPKLKKEIIIMDRSYLSTFAYQSVLLNLSIKKLQDLHTIFNIPISRAIVFVLLAKPSMIRERLSRNHILHTTLDNKTLNHINEKYKMLKNIFRKFKFIYLDAEESKERLVEIVINELKNLQFKA